MKVIQLISCIPNHYLRSIFSKFVGENMSVYPSLNSLIFCGELCKGTVSLGFSLTKPFLVFTYQLRAGFTCLNTDDLCHLGCHSLWNFSVTWGSPCPAAASPSGLPGDVRWPELLIFEQLNQGCISKLLRKT